MKIDDCYFKLTFILLNCNHENKTYLKIFKYYFFSLYNYMLGHFGLTDARNFTDVVIVPASVS